MEAIESPLICYPMRFEPGADLREGLLTFAEKNDLSAAFIVTCVGSVTKAILRMANSKTVSTVTSQISAPRVLLSTPTPSAPIADLIGDSICPEI